MQSNYKKFLPHLVVFVLFIVASLAYFNPVLQGKKIFQSDIVQYTGMAKQQNDFRKATGEETYWTDAAFGGMPTYQLGAKYPNNYIKQLDLAIRFLPRPADYLFLYFIGMYILFLVLKVDYKLAFLGALAFGFSTYLIIILGVGHNAKAHAIAYMPFVLSGIFLTFRGKYLWGFLLLTVSMGLELVANHFQMTYYLMLLVVIIGIVYLIDAFKKKLLPHYFKAVGIMVIGVLIAVGLNATNILATKEYADTSTRGKTELTINADGTPKDNKTGLDFDYITEYSYGMLESFNLFIPNFMGGSSTEEFPKDSKTVESLMRMGASSQEANQALRQIPMYWGNQTFVGAPAYIGAIVIFLSVLALFLIRGRLKWWVVSGFGLTLLLSWGKNFSGLTEFFIDYVPMYDKFRAVSSIQVIIELILPILAIVGLHQYFSNFEREEEKKKALLWSTGIVGGLTLLFILFKSALFDFASPYDSYFRDEMGLPFLEAIREDRMSLFTSDAIRSLIFVVLTAAVLWFFMKGTLKKGFAIAALCVLVLVDLVGVDRRYVNEDAFVQAKMVNEPFQMNGADEQILKDEGHYRVYDATTNAFNSGKASYYHNALGGYHAAKPGRMQDLFEFYISQGNIGILNMMNVRYIITQAKNGGPVAQRNPYANGDAWFVENVQPANNANEEIQLLDSLDTKKTAVINKEFLSKIPNQNMKRDSTATIELFSHQPNKLVYEASTKSSQLAIFSEVYYPKGWNAYINGKPAEYFRADYLLRAMVIPPGNNKIEFKFEPKVIQTGRTISLASTIVFLLILLSGLYFVFRKKEMKE
ncbi:Bacterial membrane protein YfhO [Aequorivita sublithincola DSM 14238]|uniref:Bacterial membrane protein YfhO n=1 Tax=Aequorivita sublithincola (strain DSM 14238 / LMG 21431 / ACAM 643 / 9-3) TaxID=746697 RepID=I3YZ40_AEQSU|nr:YfhO family protein [Aequorivita sublithincola]AFL82258.1 Bacterial membrane protein YfhO [Aequorivita sublithincola DSM 14238]